MLQIQVHNRCQLVLQPEQPSQDPPVPFRLGSSIGKSGAAAKAKQKIWNPDLAELSHPEERPGSSLGKALPVVTAYTRQHYILGGPLHGFDCDLQGRRFPEAFDPAGTLSTASFSRHFHALELQRSSKPLFVCPTTIAASAHLQLANPMGSLEGGRSDAFAWASTWKPVNSGSGIVRTSFAAFMVRPLAAFVEAENDLARLGWLKLTDDETIERRIDDDAPLSHEQCLSFASLSTDGR